MLFFKILKLFRLFLGTEIMEERKKKIRKIVFSCFVSL